jgi:hypothetical protein
VISAAEWLRPARFRHASDHHSRRPARKVAAAPTGAAANAHRTIGAMDERVQTPNVADGRNQLQLTPRPDRCCVH